jgi:hypothetical protein
LIVVPQPEAVMMIASSPSPSISAHPGIDIAARCLQRFVFLAHVMDQRAAAPLATGQNHFDVFARQKINRGLVDRRD